MIKVILLSVLGLFVFTGCLALDGRSIVPRSNHYDQHQPPAHAPAHGRRAQQHRYHYYPEAEFYFDTARRMYFYMNRAGEWNFSVNLPLYLRGYMNGSYVEIEMEENRPYVKHHDHKNRYKKHKHKVKKHHKKKHKKYDDYEDEEEYEGGYKRGKRDDRD